MAILCAGSDTRSKSASVCLVVALGVGLAASAGAAEVAVGYEASFHSHYVWRGVVLTDDPVFQPSITASVGNFSINTWGNFELGDVNSSSGEFTELDVTLSYAVPLEGSVSLEVGLIEYTFPNIGLDTTREVYLSLGFDTVAAPFLSVYYDFEGADDLYANGGIEFGSSFSDDAWSWALSLSVGYAGSDWAAFAAGGRSSGLFDGIANLGIGYEKDAFSFGVYVAYLENLDDDVLPEQPVDFFGGMSFGWSF